MLAALLLTMSAAAAAASSPTEIRTLDLHKEEDLYIVRAETYIDAPLQGVYEVLVDYEGFHRISSFIDETRFIDRVDDDGEGIVYTRLKGCLLAFCKTIERIERLEVVPGQRITATVIEDQSDVNYARAVWEVFPEGDGTLLTYDLEVDLGFWIPPVLGPAVIRGLLKSRGLRAALRVEALAKGEEPEGALAVAR
jgi:hypothetical protein